MSSISDRTDSESDLIPIITTPCDQRVQAIRENKAEDVDDLSFAVGEVITISKKDGAGWAFGTCADGSSGWFPLEKVELVYEQPIAEVGTVTGESALDAFIKEAKEKPATNLGPKVNKLQIRQLSLTNFLKERPMIDQLVSQHILPSSETTKQVAEAQARLLKNQKKNRKQKSDIVAGQLTKGWRPDNPLHLTETQIDRFVVDVLAEIPVSKQKKRLSSYDDVFNGATLLQYLKAKGSLLGGKWEDGLPIEVALQFAANLLERNIMFNVVDPSKQIFKPKHLYQLTIKLTDYSILNFGKICHTPELPPNGYQLSICLVGEMAETMKKYLPNFEALKKSPELVRIGLHLAELQNVSVDGLSMTVKEQMVMFVNLYNALVMYTHAKFVPPTTALDRRFLYEHCMLYFNKKRYSLQDLENEAIKFATKEDPLLYFCLSDCTKSTPATFLLSSENYDVTKVYAARHFLYRALVFDANNYEMTFPKMCQRIWKDLNLTKDELVDLIQPYLSQEQRTDVANTREIGGKIEVKFSQYSFEPSYVFEEASPLSPR